MSNQCCSDFTSTNPTLVCTADPCIVNANAGFTGIGTDGSVWVFLGGDPCDINNWFRPIVCCSVVTDNGDGTYTHDDGRGNITIIDVNQAIPNADEIPFVPIVGCITATNVQGAIQQLADKIRPFQILGQAPEATNCDDVANADNIYHSGNVVISDTVAGNNANFIVEGTTALGANDHGNMGAFASVLSGTNNTASGINSTASGANNTASGLNSTATGGNGNTATGENSAIIGGTQLSTDAINSTMLGGQTSTITGGDSSTIIGAFGSNINNANRSLITGSVNSNITQANASSVISSNNGTITNGNNNNITASVTSSIIGGASFSHIAASSNSLINASPFTTILSALNSQSINGGQRNLITQAVNSTISSVLAENTIMASDNSLIGPAAGNNNAITYGFNNTIVAGDVNVIHGSNLNTINTPGTNNNGIYSSQLSTITGATSRAVIIGATGSNITAGVSGFIAGGTNNDIAAGGGFTWGQDANVLAGHTDSMVLNGNIALPLNSNAVGSLSASFPGGIRFFSNAANTTGVALAPGANAWVAISDRSTKKNIQAVNTATILNKFNSVDVFSYKVKDNCYCNYESIQERLDELDEAIMKSDNEGDIEAYRSEKAALIESAKTEHNRTFIGVMADDVNQHFGDIFTPYTMQTSTGVKQALSDNALINILWATVRELNKKVKTLEVKAGINLGGLL